MPANISLPTAAAIVSLLAASAALADAPTSLHDTDPAIGDEEMAPDIVVVAGASRGAIASDIQPEQTFDEDDIRAFGTGSLQELITELAAETTSIRGGGGQPVVLLNGHRVSGFREIHNIPPEAIRTLQIFPEETALAYGFRADQRVVNVILKDQFQSQTLEANAGGPTAGKRLDAGIDASLFRVAGESRLLLDLSYAHSNAVLESAHGVVSRQSGAPFAIDGNVVGASGAEIDPALSALAGEEVTIAGVPAGAAAAPPTLSGFAANANVANVTDLGRYRTLLPRTHDFSAGASITRPLSTQVQMTLSARLTAAIQQSRQGLATADLLLPGGSPWSPFADDVRLLSYVDAPGALLRDSSTWSGRLAAAFNGQTSGWTWAVTASHDRSIAKTTTGRGVDTTDAQAELLAGAPDFNPFAVNALNGPLLQEFSRSTQTESLIDANASGSLLRLPAGSVALNLAAAVDHQRSNSVAERLAGTSETILSRTDTSGQASIDVPLASRAMDVLQPLGDLSLNANLNFDRYSDFGSLVGWGAGLTWRPVPMLQIIGSYTASRNAPSMAQLGGPLIDTPNVPIFDFVTGDTVEITRLDGGNAALRAEHQQVWKLGARLQPLGSQNFNIQADYVRTRTSDPVMGFPAATAEIEAAFPGRFQRDANGRLVALDNRPVNFASADRSELRWGVNITRMLKSASNAEPAGRGERGAGGPGGPGGGEHGAGRGGGARAMGGGRGGRGGFGGGRVRLSLFHSWRFADKVLIRDGLPELDMLHGSAASSSGGTPQHLLEARVSAMKSGIGGFLSADWQSGTSVASTGSNGSTGTVGDLRFSSLTTVNLRLFVNLGDQPKLVAKMPWLANTRLSLNVGNLLNDRIDVRDAAGNTPLSYQSWYMDPIGRSVKLTLRKMFM